MLYYNMPTENNIEGIFYNKEIFEQYNLKEPKTVDELLQICAMLKDEI